MWAVLFFIMCLLVTIEFIAKRKYKLGILFTIPIIVLTVTFIWHFTLLPYTLNLKDAPKIQFIHFRNATEKERVSFSNNIDYPLYIIEFSSNMRLDECRKSHYRMYCSPKELDSYEDILTNTDTILFVSEEIALIKEVKSKCIYYVPIQFLSSSHALITNNIVQDKDINTDLHCKVFFIGMLQPIVSTSEMIIPLNCIKKAHNN